ncbi:hypothetical protein SAMN05518672_102723 [Chitinophaga sp. CF118]|uniref:hypothetical protein n=1 Tax=Chitinophaga sp. CF118 TaxID=1884367 RepID=UPI0008F10168|nr:hypothetical protein [Chitinophaga sp. CF118]SFD63586.1 hypothetical protein SAMN05518672_102723 [Chitinophaga sp. CF118]
MKKNYLFLALIIISVALSCSKKSNDDPKSETGYTVMSNGRDPLIVAYSKGADSIDFFGNRDANGVPLIINTIVVRTNNDTTKVLIDDLGRPTNIFASNGIQFQFNWLEEQIAAVTVISKDGQQQINTVADFSKAPSGRLPVNTKNRRAGKRSSIQFIPHNNRLGNSTAGAKDASDVQVNLSACGLPTDGNVTVYLKSKSGNNLGYFPAYSTEKGKYIAQVPTNKAPSFNPAEACEKIAGVMGKACYVTKVPGLPLQLCAYLTIAVALTEVGAPFAPAVFEACASATTALALYCSTLGAGPAPGAPSIATVLCESSFLNREFKEEIYLYAGVTALPSDVYSPWQLVAGEGPFPILSLGLSSTTTIRSLTLSPASPATGEAYVAKADIYCLKTGATVTLSIIGTDEYTDSETTTITDAQKDGIFTLNVPGAETGIQDEVTLTITQPDGSTLTRTANLVFN